MLLNVIKYLPNLAYCEESEVCNENEVEADNSQMIEYDLSQPQISNS